MTEKKRPRSAQTIVAQIRKAPVYERGEQGNVVQTPANAFVSPKDNSIQ